MSSPALQFILFLFAFVCVWLGAGLVVDSISALATRLKISRFMLSFFVLGMFTSLPEMMIGIFSIADGQPQVFVGNLLGGIIVIMLFVIPLLAIVGNGVSSPWRVSRHDLLLILAVTLAPSLLLADQRVTQIKAIFFVLAYVFLFLYFAYEQSLFEKVLTTVRSSSKSAKSSFFHLLAGLILLLIGGYQIVHSTEFFSLYFSVPTFFVSLIAVSLGTNIPEISLIFRSIKKGKKDIALADYLGSAAANVPLLGIFSLAYGEEIVLPDHFFQRVIFTMLGIGLFFKFSGTQRNLSRLEGVILFLLYIAFIGIESYIAFELS